MWVVGLETKHMSRKALEAWAKLSVEDRAVLQYAYKDSIMFPHKIKGLIWSTLKVGVKYITVWQYSIGYANFITLECEDQYVIWDLWIDEEIDYALAAE